MSDEEVCNNCGKPLPANWKDNFCPGGKCAKEYAKKHKPGRKAVDLVSIASRVASRRESLERPGTESSVMMDITFSADFEGTVSKDVLTKKFEDEVMAALESSIKIISRELRIHPTQVRVKPLQIEVDIGIEDSE